MGQRTKPMLKTFLIIMAAINEQIFQLHLKRAHNYVELGTNDHLKFTKTTTSDWNSTAEQVRPLLKDSNKVLPLWDINFN